MQRDQIRRYNLADLIIISDTDVTFDHVTTLWDVLSDHNHVKFNLNLQKLIMDSD